MATSSSSSVTPVTAPPGAIALNPTEEKFVTLLDEFAKGYNPPIECRIAGGWVRDKASVASISLE